jgi:hypothetical protein
MSDVVDDSNVRMSYVRTQITFCACLDLTADRHECCIRTRTRPLHSLMQKQQTQLQTGMNSHGLELPSVFE